MSVKQLTTLLGLTGRLLVEGFLEVEVRVHDVKEAYGDLRVLVEPVAGTGKMWVSTRRVRGLPTAIVG